MISGEELNKKFEKLAKNEKAPAKLKKKEGKYSKSIKDELIWELEERKISHLKSWSKPQMIKRLEEDDETKVVLSGVKDEKIELIQRLSSEYMECEMVYQTSMQEIEMKQKAINRLAVRRDKVYDKMQKITTTLEYLK
jgi:hypothetical protein